MFVSNNFLNFEGCNSEKQWFGLVQPCLLYQDLFDGQKQIKHNFFKVFDLFLLHLS